MEARGWSDAKKRRQPPEARKGKKMDSFLDPPEGTRTTDTLTLYQ